MNEILALVVNGDSTTPALAYFLIPRITNSLIISVRQWCVTLTHSDSDYGQGRQSELITNELGIALARVCAMAHGVATL